MVLIRFEFNNKIISEKMVSIAKYDKHNITTIIDLYFYRQRKHESI